MPTETAVPEVKLAKVGDDRERKRGGVGLLGSSAGRGSAGSSVFLEGILGRGIALLLPKILTVTMVGCLSYGAYAVGLALKSMGETAKAKVQAKSKPFSTKPAVEPKYNGSSADLLQTSVSKDSLSMVSGSYDGKTPAERAAAGNASKAAPEAGKTDGAAPAEQPTAPAAPAAVDANAIAASAMANAGGAAGGNVAGKKDGGAKGFGAFGAALGGSSHATSLSPVAGLGQGVAGANRLGGAIGTVSRGSSRTSSALGRVANPGRGLARAQLGRASQLSAAGARAGVSETAAQNAQNAFQAPVGGGSAISGGGAQTGGAGGEKAAAAASPGGSGSGGQSNPSLGGGGGATAGDDCGAIFPDGGFINGSAGGCVCPPGMDGDGTQCSAVKSSNATPWQAMSNIAAALLILASMLLIAAFFVGKSPQSYGVAKWICYIAALLAGIATLIGISMAVMGGGAEIQGWIYAIGGGITTGMAIYAADKYSDAQSAVDAKANALQPAKPATAGTTQTPAGSTTYANTGTTPIQVQGATVPAGGQVTVSGGAVPTSASAVPSAPTPPATGTVAPDTLAPDWWAPIGGAAAGGAAGGIGASGVATVH